MSLSYVREALVNVGAKVPEFRPSSMKRSTAVALSVAGVCALTATAIYWRRKRQKQFPADKKDVEVASVSKRFRRKYNRRTKSHISVASTVDSSPSSVKLLKRRSRKNSHSASLSSSVTSSTRSRWRRPPLDPESAVEIEKLYKEGVNSFENALEKWERATVIIQNTPPNNSVVVPGDHTNVMPNMPETSHGDVECSTLEKVSSYLLTATPPSTVKVNKRFRSESMTLPYQPTNLNNGLHSSSEGNINELINTFESNMYMKDDHGDSTGTISFEEQLRSIVNRAQHLQETFDHVLYDDSDTASDTDITLTGFDDHTTSDDDSESNESYVSAKETWETPSADFHHRNLYMYEQALKAVERGEVLCRTSRADLLNCYSEEEFLAKLHCVRQGVEVMLQDHSVRQWLVETGGSMIECILCIAQRNIDEFHVAFSNMVEFVNQEDNWHIIDKELKHRKVAQMTFYDIVLDFLIMDAFDDLENPPAAVVSIMQNRWLANTLKESAISTAVWSVLKAKRTRLEFPRGFRSHLYDISIHVTPVLAWGFMGPEGKLKDVCEYFKKEVLEFLRGLFSFDHIRYTTPAQMADDILSLTRERFSSLLHYLRNSSVQEEMTNGYHIS